MAVEAKTNFGHLTDVEMGDAYDAWAILETKLDDLPKGAKAYFKELCAKVEEFDPHEDEEIALINHLEIPVIRAKVRKRLGAKSRHDFAHIFDWVQGWQKMEGVNLEKALNEYIEVHELKAEEFDMVKVAYHKVRRTRLESMEQDRPHMSLADLKPKRDRAAFDCDDHTTGDT